MKTKTFLLISLLSFLFSINVSACTLNEEYINWTKLPEEQRNEYIAPTMCKENIKSSNAKINLEDDTISNSIEVSGYHNTLKASITDSRYSAVDYNLVTSVKNQRNTNTCWTFSTTSLLETALIKNGLADKAIDLSERHVEYSLSNNAFTDKTNDNTYNRDLNSGGYTDMAVSYYFKGEGPLLESEVPFQNSSSKVNSSTILGVSTPLYLLDEYQNINYNSGACTTNQKNLIKQAILDYGSVSASYYNDNDYFTDDYAYYAYTTTLYTQENAGLSQAENGVYSNHAITIVGWDDNISASNFVSSANVKSKGAWIVKNSWGSSVGESGYIYISYEDIHICDEVEVFTKVSKNYYDEVNYSNVTSPNLVLSVDNATSATIFDYSGVDKYINRVSFFAPENAKYTAYISKNANYKDTSTWTKLGEGNTNEYGVYTIYFDEIKITSNYAIILQFESQDSDSISYPISCSITNNSSSVNYNMKISKTNSFVNLTSNISSSSWYNIYDEYNGYTYQSISIGGCNNIVYTYLSTETIDYRGTFSIKSITNSATDIYAGSGDYFTIKVDSENVVNYNNFSIKITNEAGNDVTSNFKIDDKISDGYVLVYPLIGLYEENYSATISLGTTLDSINFEVKSFLTSNSSSVSITAENGIYIKSLENKTFTKEELINDLTMNSEYKILNSSNTDVTDTTIYIGTGYSLVINDITVPIVVKGDINGDGKILSNDPLLISKYIVGTKTLTKEQLKACDVSGDGEIKSNDPLQLSKFIVGTKTSI